MDKAHVVRKSKKNNPLTIKPMLGKTKSRGLYYPGPDFVYGAVTTFKDGGVAEAISSWHTPSLSSARSAHYGKAKQDFVALNRQGVKSGLVRVKEFQEYYATHDIPVASKEWRHKSITGEIPQNMTFGQPTRPGTSIAALLENRYARQWQEKQQAKERELLAAQQDKAHLLRVQDTRTTLLRKNRPQVEVPSLWQLPRYQQVGPALDTFRDPEARKKAMAAHHMNMGGQGLLGEGTVN